MSFDQLLTALVGTRESFEIALGNVRQVDAGALITSLLTALDAEETIPNAERERRLGAVFSRAILENSDLTLIGEAGAAIRNPVLRNALTQLLPAEHKASLFRARRAGQAEPLRPESSLEAIAEETQHLLVDENRAFSDVIILSLEDEPATKKLLEGAGFVPLRCESTEKLDAMLRANEEICAFLVDSSFLVPLSRDQQDALISKLATFSTFAWLRFQMEALLPNNVEVSQRIGRARCRTSGPAAIEVSFGDRAGLQQRDIPLLDAARQRLNEVNSRGLFVPGELAGLELKVLSAAMCQYSKKRRFDPRAELTTVTARFLQGGQTGARVALVKLNDLQVPVIVKIAPKEFILDEALRFLSFIYKDNDELQPEVHLHSNAALIVFGIIPDHQGRDEQPAPTLEQRLTDYWYDEVRGPNHCEDPSQLINGFTDAARRLARLNSQQCTVNTFESKANPYLVSVKDMEQAGFDWRFANRILEARDRAEQLFTRAIHSAICHGDAHTRNILIRGERGFLIDYAYSGPGHPCTDLVKLELSVYLTRFVQLGSEDELAELQRHLSIDRLPLPELIRKHEQILRCKTNQLCITMCTIARDLAFQVLERHHLDPKHYIATKILTAWPTLQNPSIQHFLARGIISALS